MIDLDHFAHRLAREYGPDRAAHVRDHLAYLDSRARWLARGIVDDDDLVPVIAAGFLVVDLIAGAVQLETQKLSDEGLPQIYRHVADLVAAHAQDLDGARL